MATTVAWVDDVQGHDLLKKYGVGWKTITITESDIDWDESLHNQARLAEPLNDDRVEKFALRMEMGTPSRPTRFPRPFVVPAKKPGMFVFASGNHRGSSSLQYIRLPKIEADLLNTGDEVLISDITCELNELNGEPQSEDDSIHHAVRKVDAGMTAKEAAARYGLPPSRVYAAIKLRDGTRDLQEAGVSVVKLTPSHIRKLAPLRRNKPVYAALGRLAPKLDLRPFSEVASEVRAADTESEQLSIIKAHERLVGRATQTKKSRATSALLGPRLTGIERLTDGKPLSDLGYTDPEDIDEISQQIRRVLKELGRLVSVSTSRDARLQGRDNGRSRGRGMGGKGRTVRLAAKKRR